MLNTVSHLNSTIPGDMGRGILYKCLYHYPGHWMWADFEQREGPLACLNDCSYVNPWDAACWGNVCIPCSGNRRWLQNPHVLPKTTLALCSSPDVWHCSLPTQQASGRRPGWVSGSHGSFLPSFLILSVPHPALSCRVPQNPFDSP